MIPVLEYFLFEFDLYCKFSFLCVYLLISVFFIIPCFCIPAFLPLQYSNKVKQCTDTVFSAYHLVMRSNL